VQPFVLPVNLENVVTDVGQAEALEIPLMRGEVRSSNNVSNRGSFDDSNKGLRQPD